MVGVATERRRHPRFELQLDIERCLPRCQPGPVGNAEHMGVDREGLGAEGHVQDDVGGLAADAGQGLQGFPASRHAP